MDETQLSLKRTYNCSHPANLFPGKKAEIEMSKNRYHLLNLNASQAGHLCGTALERRRSLGGTWSFYTEPNLS